MGGGAAFGQKEGEACGLEGRSLRPGFHGPGLSDGGPVYPVLCWPLLPPSSVIEEPVPGPSSVLHDSVPGDPSPVVSPSAPPAPPRSLCLLTYTSSSRGFWPISPLLLLCRMPSLRLLLWWRTLTLLHHFPYLVRRLSHTGWICPPVSDDPPSEEELEPEVLPESWAPVPPDWQVSQVAGSTILLRRDGATHGEAVPVPGQEVCWGTLCHSPLPSWHFRPLS
ncbi:hypothetical protein E2C01_074702 [Portunus trituberculatus]|uniref:Uncharacterized protein n=1 Tax=Portunus trituberculatus TaxID=210409 RepID=A0A5B7ICY5_PORTR|nr:hypothetical protein [Portunus trituberculatus]